MPPTEGGDVGADGNPPVRHDWQTGQHYTRTEVFRRDAVPVGGTVVSNDEGNNSNNGVIAYSVSPFHRYVEPLPLSPHQSQF